MAALMVSALSMGLLATLIRAAVSYALWEEELARCREIAEQLPHRIAALVPPEMRTQVERDARIEIQKMMDLAEWPGMAPCTTGNTSTY